MLTITDEYMRQNLSKTKNYSVVILKATEKSREPGAEKIIWEHGRRNFALRSDGLLSIVCPFTDSGDIAGIGIFNADNGTVKAIMEEDPGIKAGIFTYEIHTCRSFPGDSLLC